MSEPTFPCWSCGTFHSASEVAEAGGYCPQCEADYDERLMMADLAQRYTTLEADRDQLKADNERLDKEAGETIAALTAQRDTLRTQLAEARELLEESSDMANGCEDSFLQQRIDAWLEANKQ